MMATESSMWIFTVLGFAYRYLNFPGKALNYLSQAAYPIYIIHMIFLYLGSYWILPLQISILMKLLLLIAFTAIGCIVLYELLIRRIPFLRPLFGLKKLSGNSRF